MISIHNETKSPPDTSVVVVVVVAHIFYIYPRIDNYKIL